MYLCHWIKPQTTEKKTEKQKKEGKKNRNRERKTGYLPSGLLKPHWKKEARGKGGRGSERKRRKRKGNSNNSTPLWASLLAFLSHSSFFPFFLLKISFSPVLLSREKKGRKREARREKREERRKGEGKSVESRERDKENKEKIRKKSGILIVLLDW